MEEINLKDLFSYFFSKSFIVIITLALAILVSTIYGEFVKVPMYRSYTTIVLTRSGDTDTNDSSITQNDILLNQKLVATYREIIKSRRVLGQVIENLNLDMEVSELSQNISVTNEEDTELIKISVSSVNKEDAKDIANEIAKVFSNEIVDIYNIKNVSIIDTAIVSKTPYNINFVKETVIAALFGLVLGIAIIFVMFYFDTTIKNPEEIQTKIGLPLLGVVPKVESENDKRIKIFNKRKRGHSL